MLDRREDPPTVVMRDTFAATLRAEVARSKRYGHPFAVFVLHPPPGSGLSESLANERVSDNLTALLTSGLVRESDVVSVLAEDRTIGVLLPETDVAGAGALLERLMAALSDPARAWSAQIYVYPEHQAEIAQIVKRAA